MKYKNPILKEIVFYNELLNKSQNPFVTGYESTILGAAVKRSTAELRCLPVQFCYRILVHHCIYGFSYYWKAVKDQPLNLEKGENYKILGLNSVDYIHETPGQLALRTKIQPTGNLTHILAAFWFRTHVTRLAALSEWQNSASDHSATRRRCLHVLAIRSTAWSTYTNLFLPSVPRSTCLIIYPFLKVQWQNAECLKLPVAPRD